MITKQQPTTRSLGALFAVAFVGLSVLPLEGAQIPRDIEELRIALDLDDQRAIKALSLEERQRLLRDWNDSGLAHRYLESLDTPTLLSTFAVVGGGIGGYFLFSDFISSAQNDLRTASRFVRDPKAREPFWQRMRWRRQIITGPDRGRAWKSLRASTHAEKTSCALRLKLFAAGAGLIAGVAGLVTLGHELSDVDIPRAVADTQALQNHNGLLQRQIISGGLQEKINQPGVFAGTEEFFIRDSMISEASHSDGSGRQAYGILLETPGFGRSLLSGRLLQLTEVRGEEGTIFWSLSGVRSLSQDQARMIFGENIQSPQFLETPVSEIKLEHFDTALAASFFRLSPP